MRKGGKRGDPREVGDGETKDPKGWNKETKIQTGEGCSSTTSNTCKRTAWTSS